MIEVEKLRARLPAMLTSVADFYEEEVNTRLQRTLIWVSPAILIVMAVVIGSLLIALYLPMFSLQIGASRLMTTVNPVPSGIPDEAAERDQARRLAERYRCPFVDLREQRIDPGAVPQHPRGNDVSLQIRSAR